MIKNRLYQDFYKKWEEVTDLPTQEIGLLTPVYKMTVPYLKYAPWRIMIPIALIVAVFLALFLDLTAIQIASLLQSGF